MDSDFYVFCADVGSITNNQFGWYADHIEGKNFSDIDAFIESIASAIKTNAKVAVGFECPIFIPVRDKKEQLTKARSDDVAGRPWSAGSGATILPTGIAQMIYIFRKLKEKIKIPDISHDMENWKYSKDSKVLFWEAIVTAKAKSHRPDKNNCPKMNKHVWDAYLAVRAFLAKIEENQINEKEVFSLVGACLLRTGWTTDINWLSHPVPVVKV